MQNSNLVADREVSEVTLDRNNRWEGYGRSLKKAASLSTVGLEIAFSVGLGYLIGDWLDGQFDTAPFGMIVMVLVGSGAGFLGLYRTLRRFQAQQDEQ